MNISYNLSEKINSYLSKIDKIRTEILLTPLSPKNELRFRWDSNLERVIWSLSLLENPLTKNDVIKILSNHATPPKKYNQFQKDVVNQSKSFSYIRDEWLASKNPVTMTTIKKLYDLSCRETMGKMSGLTQYSEEKINILLSYLSKGQDNPVIQAGIAQIELINITPFDNGNGRVARLLSYIFLYKNGFDVRGLISFEEYLKRDMVTFKRVLDVAKAQDNLTLWLEYFAYAIMTSLEKAFETIKKQEFQEELPTVYWKVNTRQKQILEYLEEPGSKITNKEVQKIHKISQITASRDLTKLTSLGLLLSHGKGRSVYYTKV